MSLRIGLGQICSSSNVKANARVVSKLINKALACQLDVLFLPEASDYISSSSEHGLLLVESVETDFVAAIKGLVRGTPLQVAVGIHSPGVNKEKVKNELLWISDGEVKHRYQKIHLFDVNVPQGPILQELKSVERGDTLCKPFSIGDGDGDETGKWKVGLGICYDIRFPEMGLALRLAGANIITYPLAFTTKTGEAHWKALGIARALDTQSYVIMAAQCGSHDTLYLRPESNNEAVVKRISYGASLVVDPWGVVVCEAKKYSDSALTDDIDQDGDYYQLVEAVLDWQLLATIRQNMPLEDHRVQWK